MVEDQENKRVPSTLYRLVFGIAIALLLSTAAVVVHQIPIVFHQKWWERGSAYDVESEYNYCLILGAAKKTIVHMGINPNNFIVATIRKWQRCYTDRAFSKIPETDGERIIWQIQLNNDFDTVKYAPQMMPAILESFEKITVMPMASKWPNDIGRFYYASQIADFFFKNSDHSGMTTEQINNWRWKITRKMEEITPQLDIDNFYKSRIDYEILEPLMWNYTIVMGASYIIYDHAQNSYNCSL